MPDSAGDEPASRPARPASGSRHRGLLRGRRATRSRARSGRGAARGRVPRHRPDDPRLARRARQLHARRRDRRARPLQRCRCRRRDQQPEEYPLGRAFMRPDRLAAVLRASQSNPFPPITMVAEQTSSCSTCSACSATSGSPPISACSRSRSRNRARRSSCRPRRARVGSIAGQIAKLRGAQVIGIAGGPAKCAWVVDELGFDACIDYKTEDVAARLKELAPQGVDVFFDNVGGELLDTVLRRLADAGPGRAVRRHLDVRRRRPVAAVAQHPVPDGQAGADGGLQHPRPLGRLRGGRRPARRVGRRRPHQAPASTSSTGSTARPRRSSASSAATTSASSSSRSTDVLEGSRPERRVAGDTDARTRGSSRRGGPAGG